MSQSQNNALYQSLASLWEQAQIDHQARRVEDLHWLCHDPNLFLLGEPIGRFGRNRPERAISSTLSTLTPPLWHRWVWSKILAEVIRTFKARTHDFIALNDSETEWFYRILHDILSQSAPRLRDFSFQDIFSFLSRALALFLTTKGLNPDLFHSEKLAHKTLCLELFEQVTEEFWGYPQFLSLSLYLSTRANWLDVADPGYHDFLQSFPEEVNRVLDDFAEIEDQILYNPYFQFTPFRNHLESGSQHILYETDNHGEVVLDFLLIRYLLDQGHRVTVIPKKEPILNDVTIHDLDTLMKETSFHVFQPYLESGQLQYFHCNAAVTGKDLFSVGKRYQDVYADCDLVYLKGQGHFQSMPMGYFRSGKMVPFKYKKPVVHSMVVKTPYIQRTLSNYLRHSFNRGDLALFVV